jgi:energy-coupling factor transporter transmembrane protein EcfT
VTIRKHRHVDGLAALIATTASICALLMLGSVSAVATYTVLMALNLLAWTGNARIGWVIVKWCLPFAVPLLFVHGVLNAGFPADRWYFGLLPLREAGLRYGATVGLHVALLATVAAYWVNTKRDDVVDDLVSLRLPLWVILFSSQSIAVGASVERRITKVYAAQRARGIRTGPSFWARVQALPSVLIPAVVGTLLEAEARVPALVSRGFGCARLAPLPRRRKPLNARLWAFVPVVLLAAVLFLRQEGP